MTPLHPTPPMATNFSAPALLVPIDVSAMVVTGRPRNFRRWTMSYGQLAYALSPEPAPFEQVVDTFSDGEANLGVYLAWTLPDALRRGVQDATTGEMAFPPVPNRWLVVRVHGDTGSAPAAWVVESDYVWPPGDAAEGTDVRGAPFLDPTPELKGPRPVRIGRKVPLGAQGWTEPGHPSGWLTAVGPGNVAFAAFQPHNTNVFSLHDELGALGVPDGTLSYFVAGWHSRPGDDDPLAGWDAAQGAEALASRLAELGWTMPAGVPAGPLPGRTVYHGMAAAVRWERDGDLAPELPGPGEVRLAVGNTAVDAFAALVDDRAAAAGSPPGAAAQLVEGALYDLLSVLDQPDGDVRLERALRDAWFGSRPGGSRWEIAAAEQRPGDPPAPPPPPAQLAAEAALLRPLNAAQAELDAACRRLASAQAGLYEIWWKSVRAPHVFEEVDPGQYPAGTGPERFAAALAAAGAESHPARVAAAMDEVAWQRDQVGRLRDRVQAALRGAPAGPAQAPERVLKEVADARFWMAGDPVVVLAGARQEGTLRPHAARACRALRDLVAGLRVARPDGGEAAVAADAAPVPVLPLGGMPPEVPQLLREFALLDPQNATVLARVPGVGDGEVQAVRAAILAPRPTAGLLPDHALGEWRAPWLPLFMEWEVHWYPIPYLGYQAGPWRFDGHDYALAQADAAVPEPQVVSGRALLVPGTAATLRTRIQQLAGERDAAGLRALDDLVARATGWDLLAQTLGGLHDQLALRDPGANLAPDGRVPVDALGRTVAELVGAGRHSVPQAGQASVPRFGAPVSAFEGVRAGQLVFSRVSVVDRFGQTVEVVTPRLAPAFTPVRARGVAAGPSIAVSGTPVQLPPRLLQPARLAFDFLAADDTPAWNAAGSPLCGWMVPNHLDGALSVYDADGGILGELRPAAGPAGARAAVWEPAPGSGAPATADALRGARPHLGDAVAALAAAGADELVRFLDTLDEASWSVSPWGERSDRLLNALIGRPLAVIRASVGLQLEGDPLSDPAWPFTFAPRRAPFTGYAWEVELGDARDRRDGLIGYWAGGYGRFHTPHSLPDAPPDGYVWPVGAGNRLLASVDGGPVRVTLLLDPRGCVSARSGLIPTREIVLPPAFVEGPLRAMQATFRAGPLLTVLRPGPTAEGAGPSAPASMPYPLPATRDGAWDWVELRDEGPPLVRPVASASGQAELLELPASLREGYLRLSAAST